MELGALELATTALVALVSSGLTLLGVLLTFRKDSARLNAETPGMRAEASKLAAEADDLQVKNYNRVFALLMERDQEILRLNNELNKLTRKTDDMLKIIDKLEEMNAVKERMFMDIQAKHETALNDRQIAIDQRNEAIKDRDFWKQQYHEVIQTIIDYLEEDDGSSNTARILAQRLGLGPDERDRPGGTERSHLDEQGEASH